MRKIKRAAVRQGPTAALEVLYRAEYTGMVRLAYTLVGSNAEAEEIVQDSFVEISPRIAGSGQQPGAYLRTVVVSRCRSALRRRQLIGQHAHRAIDARGRDPATRDQVLPVLWTVRREMVGNRDGSGGV